MIAVRLRGGTTGRGVGKLGAQDALGEGARDLDGGETDRGGVGAEEGR